MEEMREGSDLFSIHAFLPAQASFGFANDMRRQSSGKFQTPTWFVFLYCRISVTPDVKFAARRRPWSKPVCSAQFIMYVCNVSYVSYSF